jgi:transposase-like protein
MGTFGRIEIEVPRARLNGLGGKTTEWNSQVLRAYQRRTLAADALIASTYLAGTNTRRVRRALKALQRAGCHWPAWGSRYAGARSKVETLQ